jgi:hypothetical protein
MSNEEFICYVLSVGCFSAIAFILGWIARGVFL